MKILEVIDLFSPAHGGSAKVAYQISKELVKRGHEVTILTTDSELSQEYKESISEVNLETFKVWLGITGYNITPGMIGQTAEKIAGYDVIHLHNYRTFQNNVIHYYAKKYGIPYVLQAHGSLATFFQKGLLKRVYDVTGGYQILREASRVLAVTRMESDQYRSMGVVPERIEIIPHGISLSEFDKLPEKGQFREKYNIDKKYRVILFLGRIHKIKGLKLLAKAFADLARIMDDVRLVIVGPDGGYLNELNGLIRDLKIEESTVVTGPLYGLDKIRAYVDADVYVLPSSYEIFGLTILEAIACGVPVVTTDRCGLADVIGQKAGLVISYDKDGIRDALANILSDSQKREKFGRNGKKIARAQFDWENIAGDVERVYQEVLRP